MSENKNKQSMLDFIGKKCGLDESMRFILYIDACLGGI